MIHQEKFIQKRTDLTTSLIQDLMSLMSNETFSYKLSLPKFEVGEIVVEKYCHSINVIPMKVIEVVFPKKDSKGRYWEGFNYRIEAAIFEDKGTYLDGKILDESLLLPFSERKKELIGAIISRVHDLEELV